MHCNNSVTAFILFRASDFKAKEQEISRLIRQEKTINNKVAIHICKSCNTLETTWCSNTDCPEPQSILADEVSENEAVG